MATREPYGTWGGVSEGERRELLPRIDPGQALRDYRAALRRWERQVHERGA
jgi:hypothetical protein